MVTVWGGLGPDRTVPSAPRPMGHADGPMGQACPMQVLWGEAVLHFRIYLDVGLCV